MKTPSVTLVIGGASSGKSAWAEGFVRDSHMAKVYLATARAGDQEIADKIEMHRGRRAGQGWRTVEAAGRLPQSLAEVDSEEIALLDCATFWLVETFFQDHPWREALVQLIEVVEQCPAPLVVVTNELGHGIVPADPATRAFRDAHGVMNQELAAAADLVVLVTAGLPQVLKGQIPW